MPGGLRALVSLAAVVLAVLAAQPVQAGGDGARTLTARDDLESAILVHINAVRRQHGLTSLRSNARLRAAADVHSAAMATRGFFAHESADGSPFWKRVQRHYTRRSYWSVGENLLWSSPDVDAAVAVQRWMASPPHRRNLLTPRWREIGLSAVHAPAAPGVYGGRPVTIVTADFGVRR
jgi:uncharacterized protein YkwD